MSITDPQFRFDEETHTYFINDRPAVSVTQVMSEILGQPYRANEFFMQRGRVVHKYAEMIGKGQAFAEPDERVAGQVEACRKFYAEVSLCTVLIEQKFYSVRYQFAGTSDLIAMMDGGEKVLIDWKATLTKQTEVQLGGYGILSGVKKGAGVQLNEDGTYKMSPIYTLKRPGQEFLSLLSAYNTKARLGMLSKDEDES